MKNNRKNRKKIKLWLGCKRFSKSWMNNYMIPWVMQRPEIMKQTRVVDTDPFCKPDLKVTVKVIPKKMVQNINIGFNVTSTFP